MQPELLTNQASQGDIGVGRCRVDMDQLTMLFWRKWLAIGQLLVEHFQTRFGSLATALTTLDDALAQRLVIGLEADHQHRQATGFCLMTQTITLHLLQAGGIDADGDARFQQRG